MPPNSRAIVLPGQIFAFYRWGGTVDAILPRLTGRPVAVRYETPYRDTKEAIANIRLVSPSGERVSLEQVCNIRVLDGASQINREVNSRYVALKYSVEGRDLGSTVEEAIAKVNRQVKLPPGYRIDWAGEYESAKRSQKRLMIVVPITLLVICLILYTMFGSIKWVLLIMANVAMAPIGGLLWEPAQEASLTDRGRMQPQMQPLWYVTGTSVAHRYVD